MTQKPLKKLRYTHIEYSHLCVYILLTHTHSFWVDFFFFELSLPEKLHTRWQNLHVSNIQYSGVRCEVVSCSLTHHISKRQENQNLCLLLLCQWHWNCCQAGGAESYRRKTSKLFIWCSTLRIKLNYIEGERFLCKQTSTETKVRQHALIANFLNTTHESFRLQVENQNWWHKEYRKSTL